MDPTASLPVEEPLRTNPQQQGTIRPPWSRLGPPLLLLSRAKRDQTTGEVVPKTPPPSSRRMLLERRRCLIKGCSNSSTRRTRRTPTNRRHCGLVSPGPGLDLTLTSSARLMGIILLLLFPITTLPTLPPLHRCTKGQTPQPPASVPMTVPTTRTDL